MSKISLVTTLGSIEIEGDEDFIKQNQNLIDKIIPSQDSEKRLTTTKQPATTSTSTGEKRGIPKSKKSPSRKKESYTLVKDLNLRPEGKESLYDFYSKKAPSSALEKTTVFVYYLSKIIGMEGITYDHIYTCYKSVSSPVPGNLRQNITDTAFRKGTIDASKSSNITITTIGENFVEYNLPIKKSND